MAYARSPFRDFESFLRIVVGLDGDDTQLILEQNISNFFDLWIIPTQAFTQLMVFQRLFTQ